MSPVSMLNGPLVWDTTIAKSSEHFTLVLSASDCAELHDALVTFKAKRLGNHSVSPANFPLPTLGGRLINLSETLHGGRGFFIVSGLDINDYSVEDSVTVYLGLASYVGDQHGIQNIKGDVLTHVTDSKLWTVPKDVRHGIHSNKSLPFHNDMGSDILALQARECAKAGGSTYLASSWSIHNDLARWQPEALEILFSNSWPIQVSGDSKYILAPLMQMRDDKLMTSVDPGRLGPHTNTTTTIEGVPDLSPEQVTALDALLESAKRNEVKVSLQKGDMLFVNNWAIMHRRESYEDGDATSRHLVRIWLRNTRLGWAIPEDMAVPWKASFEREHIKKVYNIHPSTEYQIPKYSAGSAAFVIDDIEKGKGKQ